MKKKFVSILLAVLLVAVMGVSLVACNKDTHKYTIVYIGDSIAEALIGPSPLGERDNYGYYAVVGKVNDFKYYNHSVSGHKTSTGIVSGDGLLEMISRNDENSVLMKTHLQEADMIHISVLGNNMLQYDLGLLMKEVADPQFVQKYNDGKNAENPEDKTLINALEEGSMDDPLVRTKIDEKTGDEVEVEFAFPSTYQDICDIVARLRALNPKAEIVFQKVYNPFYDNSKHITDLVKADLAEITDDGRFGHQGQKIVGTEHIRRVADYLLGCLNGMLDRYNDEHQNAKVRILDARQAFEDVTNDPNVGNGDLSENGWARKLIYEDWTHPSNFGHAVIAGLTQNLLDELKVSSPNAVKNYKSLRVDQLNRLYKNVENFNLQAAIDSVNNASDFYGVTVAYFKAIDGYTPVYEKAESNPVKSSFGKDVRLSVDMSKTQLGMSGIGELVPPIMNFVVDFDDSYMLLKQDGTMHVQLRTVEGLFGEKLDDLLNLIKTFVPTLDLGEALTSFDIEGGVRDMVEPMFPGFAAKLKQGDLKGALDLIEASLGFNIVGLDYNNENVKYVLNYVAENMTLPSDLLDRLPADTRIAITFDTQYYVKELKGKDGKTYTGIYVSPIGANENTQPFCVFDTTYEDGKMKVFFKIDFMNLSIAFKE